MSYACTVCGTMVEGNNPCPVCASNDELDVLRRIEGLLEEILKFIKDVHFERR